MMVQRTGSKLEAKGFSAAACATGVDVSQDELTEICSEQNVLCDGEAAGGASGTGPVGVSGGSGAGTSGSTGSGSGGTSGSSTSTGGSSGIAGGSGSSGASTGGNAGSSSTTLQPLAKGMCMATSSVVITYTDRGKGTTDNQATMALKVQNMGPAFDLTALTIRYWFTDDGAGDFTSNVDYASQSGGQNLTSAVTVTFGKESGSNYAAIGFSSGGSVDMGGGVNEIQVRLHTNDYKMVDQSNDFSYQGSASSVSNPNITPYVNGTQVGGCVPIAP